MILHLLKVPLNSEDSLLRFAPPANDYKFSRLGDIKLVRQHISRDHGLSAVVKVAKTWMHDIVCQFVKSEINREQSRLERNV